jgi:hypothetical protein
LIWASHVPSSFCLRELARELGLTFIVKNIIRIFDQMSISEAVVRLIIKRKSDLLITTKEKGQR